MTIPNLTTERLILSAPQSADFDAFARLWTLPEIYHYILGEPRSRADSWRAYLTNFGAWSHLGYGMWLVKLRSTQEVIGQCGFLSGMRGLGGDFNDFPEVGWLFDGDYHGKGYAHEAMQAALNWYDGAGIAEKSVCMIDPANVPSLKLAAKLGFDKTRLSEFHGEMLQLFERKKS